MSKKLEPFTMTVRRGVWAFRFQGWPSGVYKSTGVKDDGKSKTRDLAFKVASDAYRAGEDVRTGTLTVWTWAERFYGEDCPHLADLASQGRIITARTKKNHSQIIRLHLKPLAIMRRQVAQVTRADARGARDEILKAMGPTRIAQLSWGILKTILKTAYSHDMISKDPLAGLGTLKYKPEARDEFTSEEIQTLFTGCPGVWKTKLGWAVFRLTYLAGLRRGEVLALTWRQVLEDRILVDRAWKDSTFETSGAPKWDKVREVPLTAPIKAMLSWWRKQVPMRGLDALVFAGLNGEPMGATWWIDRFKAALEAAGINTEGRKLTPHSLRHTIASDLAGSGVPADVIRGALGWTNEATRGRYTHMDADRQRDSMEAGMAKLASK